MKKILMPLILLDIVPRGGAQVNAASINEQVTDLRGAAAPGATIVVPEKGTSADTKVVTSGSGFCLLRSLPIGDFSVTATVAGFERHIRSDITLATAQALEVGLTMAVGKVSETVELTGNASLIETHTADYIQFVESKTVSAVPLCNLKMLNVVQTIGVPMFLNDDPDGIMIQSSTSGGNRMHASAYEFPRNEDARTPGCFAPFYNPSTFSGQNRYNIYDGATSTCSAI